MINYSDFFINESPYKYVTYSYEEGLSKVWQIMNVVLLIALINLIISLIIGIRKRDCLAILVTNIMVKTIAIFLCQVVYDWIYLAGLPMIILFFISAIIIEGFIYKKVLKYKKHNGIVVSVICNMGTVITTILWLIDLLY